MDGNEGEPVFMNVLLTSYPGSGTTWIVNFLIELGVPTYACLPGKDIKDMWNFLDEHRATLMSKKDHFKLWLPVLSKKTIFNFTEIIQVRWTHELPNKNNINQKIILLTRDGRDVLYSQYRRENFCQSFESMLFESSGPLEVDYPIQWALHVYLWWHIMPSEKLLHVTFEEIKKNPQGVGKKILAFLNIKREICDIEAAIDASTFEKAKAAEITYRTKMFNKGSNIQSSLPYTVINRKGKAGEWKEIYKAKELISFLGFPNLVLKMAGYEISSDSTLHIPIQNYISSQSKIFEKGEKILATHWRKTLDLPTKIEPIIYQAVKNIGPRLCIGIGITKQFIRRGEYIKALYMAKIFQKNLGPLLLKTYKEILREKYLKLKYWLKKCVKKNLLQNNEY